MVMENERVFDSIVILQQMESSCGLTAVLLPIFRVVPLVRMVTGVASPYNI